MGGFARARSGTRSWILPPDTVADGEVHRHDVALVQPSRGWWWWSARSSCPTGRPRSGSRSAPMRGSWRSRRPRSRARWPSRSSCWASLCSRPPVVQVEVGLRPLARLRRELAAVRSGLRKRFATSVPVEVEPLTQDLNLLLEHSEAVLARARVQAGNLAHALKADLAVLTNEVRELAPANVARDGAAARGAARADAPPSRPPHGAGPGRGGAGRAGCRHRDRPVASGLARTLERLHAERGLAIELDLPPGLRFGGEQEDLQEMLGNLMDNACKWARRRVRVAGRAEGRDAVAPRRRGRRAGSAGGPELRGAGHRACGSTRACLAPASVSRWCVTSPSSMAGRCGWARRSSVAFRAELRLPAARG